MVSSVDFAPIILILVLAALLITWRRGSDEYEGNRDYGMSLAPGLPAPVEQPPVVIAPPPVPTTTQCKKTTVKDTVGNVLYTGPCNAVITVVGKGATTGGVGGGEVDNVYNFYGSGGPMGPVGGSDDTWSTMKQVGQDKTGWGTLLKSDGGGDPWIGNNVPDYDGSDIGSGRFSLDTPNSKDNGKLIHNCADGTNVKPGQVCPGQDANLPVGVGSAGAYSLKFMDPTHVWVDAESKRLFNNYKPGTKFDFITVRKTPGVMRFGTPKTLKAYEITLSGPAVKELGFGRSPDVAPATLIYVYTPVKYVETPNLLPDAVGSASDLKKETLGTFNDAKFGSVTSMLSGGKAYSRVSTAPGWVYFRMGTSTGAQANSPFFRVKRLGGGAKSGALPVQIQEYDEARGAWRPLNTNVPSIRTGAGASNVMLELRPKWQNSQVLSTRKVTKFEGGALATGAKISGRFVPQNGVKGTGANKYQEVFDETLGVMGKYYLQSGKLEIPGVNIPGGARLRCPTGRPMRRNTSCAPAK